MKNNIQRILSVFLTVIMVVGMIPIASFPVSAATTLSLAQLKEKFPHGAFWNCVGKNGNNQDGVTYSPCPSHSSTSTCNGYAPNGTEVAWQCYGFACKLGLDAYGTDPRATWPREYNLDNIKPGDIINYDGNDPGHTVFVIGVNGNTVTLAECNYNEGNPQKRCIITWGRQMQKSQFNNLYNVYSAPYALDGYTPTPTPTPNHSCSSCVSINKTGSVTAAVNIRTSPSTSGTLIGEFSAGTSVTISAKCGNWYLVKNSGGTNGWAHANYIKVKESTSSGHECSNCVTVNKSGYVISDVNVRTGPGTSYTFLFEYYTGTDLLISVECNGWYFVSDAGGNSGWVAGNFVKVDSTHYHDYVWNYEAAHPHKEYVKCSCGDYEYTGENYFDKIYSTENEYAHPHNEYKICGICGQTEYTGATRYVDSCTTCNPPHTHSYTTYHDATHPHREYKKCSCGDYYYLDSYYYDSGCITCNPPKYTITFDANGGNWSGGNLIKTHDVSVTIPNTYPTRTGYAFRGWSTSQNGTVAYLGGETYTANSSITLYAVWKANTYSIKYNANGGSGTMSNSSHTYDTAKALTANAFTRIGYNFLGWSTSASATSATYTDKQSVKNLTSTNGGTVNLYAVWQANTYTVKYNANGGSGTMSNSSHTYDAAKALSANEYTRSGYTFLGWSTSSSATSATYTDKQSVKNLTSTNGGTVNLYAVWQANTYTVKYNANGGSGSMSSSTHTYDAAKALSANAFTRSGYTFLGWSTSASATSATYTDKQSVKNLTSTNGGTVNLYAVWAEKEKYTITFDTKSSQMTISPYTKYQDEDVKMFAFTPTRKGYTFKEWLATDGTTYTSDSVYTANESTTLVAQWIPITYTIHYNANGGSGTMSDSSHTYDIEKTLSVNAFVRSGYSFLGWSTDPSATSATYTDKQSVKNLTSTNNGSVALYAVWKEEETYQIEIWIVDGDDTEEIMLTKQKGDIIDLSNYKPQRTGYTFIAWRDLSTGDYYSANDKYVVTRDTLLVSGMQANTYIVFFDANGGVVTEDLKSVKFNSEYSQLPIPTRNGYTFNGWYTKPDGGEIITSKTIVKTPENHTIYAHWSAETYTVTYNANGGNDAPESQVKIYGQNLTLSKRIPTKTGYAFIGWATNSMATSADYQSGDIYTANTDITLYAVWQQNTVLSDISVEKMPIQTTYLTGETFVSDGLTIKLTYSDGSTKTITSGFTVSGFDSTTSGTKEITVTYNGRKTTFYIVVEALRYIVSGDKVTITGCGSSETTVIIPETIDGKRVTAIAEYAFKNCNTLVEILIPKTITSVGYGAFEGCTSLKKVTMTSLYAWCKIDFAHYTSNPTYYAKHLYVNDKEMTSVTISANIGSVKNYTFINCTGIKTIKIADGITAIGEYAFYGCKAASNVTIAKSVTSIGRYAFRNCSVLGDIAISENVTSIGANAFNNCPAITLRVSSGSVAHTYAQINGITYKLNEDIDGDGVMTNSDVALLVRVIAGWETGCETPYADITGDGKINNRDIIAIIKKLAMA